MYYFTAYSLSPNGLQNYKTTIMINFFKNTGK